MTYDPKTAFGNPVLIAQAKKQAEQELIAKNTVSTDNWTKTIEVSGCSKCPFCGAINYFEFDDDLYDFDENCNNCFKDYIVQLD